jgi:hypothetical protein
MTQRAVFRLNKHLKRPEEKQVRGADPRLSFLVLTGSGHMHRLHVSRGVGKLTIRACAPDSWVGDTACNLQLGLMGARSGRCSPGYRQGLGTVEEVGHFYLSSARMRRRPKPLISNALLVSNIRASYLFLCFGFLTNFSSSAIRRYRVA